jgi:HK97 family phage major capsid protein
VFIELKKEYLGNPAGKRIDVAEPDAQHLISQGTAAAVVDDPIAPLLARSVDTLLANLTRTLNSTLDAALAEFAQAQTRSRRHAAPILFGAGSHGEPKRTFGQFLLAVRNHDHRALEEMGSRWCEWETAGQKTALSTQTGAQGGYTVPPEFHDRLMSLVAEASIVRPRATVLPMAARSLQVPALDVTTAAASGDTAYLGGLVARWTEEATTLNQTEPTFKQVDLTNYELSGYSKLSNTLLQDSAIGLEAFLMQLFSRAIAWYEDHAFLRGNGTAKPLGVLNWTGLISVTRSAASAFALADAAGMLARLLPGYSPQSTCWVIHPTVIVKLLQMADAEGNIIFIDNARDRPSMTLFGLPVEVSEKLPALNTLGDVLLCDFQHYLLGDRMQIEIAFSEHAAFLSNQSVWRFVSRVAGQPWLRDKVTLADASNTLSPFVGLAAG